jgi:two-component system alkaline phosphatase synthesis response regulator PhoP
MKKLILLIDDDVTLHHWMKEALPRDLFILESASTGREGLDMALLRKPDLILLDLNLAGWSGLELCKTLKETKETAHIPLFMLTGQVHTQRKILAFELGADDYLTKPFEMLELVARIKAVLRRHGAVPEDIVQLAGITLNLTAYSANVDKKPLKLTATEFGLLHMLMKNPGRILTRKHLLERIWGYAEDISTRTVDVYVRRLRQKLGTRRSVCIESIHGIGYKFKGHPAAPTPPFATTLQGKVTGLRDYPRAALPAFS